ncbi:MAG: hypothetical protein ABSD48_01305 [Armatimonadota bacterium]|jgi:hypothetical protein
MVVVKPRLRAILFGLICAYVSGLQPAAQAAGLAPDAERVARGFITAFSVNDRATIQSMLPKSAQNLYGPCPFAKMPQISNPRADGRVAAVNFSGVMADPDLPRQGVIVLRLVEEGASNAWKVRQLYWFTDLPPEAQIPDKSATAADRRQEPAVRKAVIAFIGAWSRRKWDEVEGLTFQWWRIHRRPPKWVKLTSVDVVGKPTTLDGLRVDFDATLRFAGLVPRSVHGNFWLVKEEGAWRVRPLTFSLLF